MTVWTAVDSFWGVAWVADMGLWTGDDTVTMPPRPAAAAQIDYFVGEYVGDLATGSFPGSYAHSFKSSFGGFDDTLSDEGVDPSTAEWFIVWHDPADPTDPADLTPPNLTPEQVAAAFTPPPPPEPRPLVSLYDTDGTYIADLPLAAGIQWQEELSAPGALSFRLPLDDSATALVTARRIVKVHWRAGFRQAARVDSSRTDVAVDGRIWREFSNLPGLMSLLGGVLIYPEYGLNRTSNSQRTFGYMSRTGTGEWLDSGDFTAAEGVTWSAMTGVRAGKPEGLDFPNPQWIAKRGPFHDESPLSYQYFRRVFTTTEAATVQILSTADNYLDLWLDGEQLVDSRGQGEYTWRNAFQVTASLPAGEHVIAARIRNHKDDAVFNPVGLLGTVQRTDTHGDVVVETPLLNTDTSWSVSDVAPGFRRAEVLSLGWSEATAYGYGAPTLITLGFTRAVDTDGVDWADAPGELTVDVGSSMLDLVGVLTEQGMDVDVDAGSLHLNAWNRRGDDKTATVQLQRGVDGGNLIGHAVDRTEPQYNTILMQLGDGRWVQRQDLASVADRGREGGGLAMGSTSDTATANQTADAQLTQAGQGTAVFTTQVSSLTGPQVYDDFDLGDTVTVPDENGTGAYAARVMAITVDASGDGAVQVTPELMLDRSATPLVLSSGGGSDPGADGTGGGTISEGGTDVAYDWTANPYGSVYGADGTTGGYVPDDDHAGVPLGSTFAQTITATGGYLTINTAASLKGTGTASSSTNKVTLAAHGMANGQPVFFSATSTDGAGLPTGVANWGVVANATADTFKVRRLNEDTGTFSTVNITGSYTSVTVMAGVWYDLVDFACHITVASGASGLILFTRCRHRGPAAALSPTGPNPAQGLIFNLSNAWVLGADQDLIPDAPVAKLDALYGKNFRTWRRKHKHVIDGVGSHGNNIGYGTYGTGAAWFYPDPEHTDGSHCDLGMQVFGGATHREVGPHIEGSVDSSVSSTSDLTGHPIPTLTNSVIQVNHASSLAAPTAVMWDKVLLGAGAFTINIDGKEDRPNLGRVNGRFKRTAHYGAIAAPSPGAKAGGATIQFDISGAVYDDDSSAIAPGNGLYVSPGSHLVP